MNVALKKKLDQMVSALPLMSSAMGANIMDTLIEQASALATSPQEKREAGKYLLQAMGQRKRTDISPKTLMEQCGEFVNLAYIAKHYFHHDKSWIYQRINGTTVNGKKAAFTNDELKTLASAMNEIGLIFLDTSHSIKQTL